MATHASVSPTQTLSDGINTKEKEKAGKRSRNFWGRKMLLKTSPGLWRKYHLCRDLRRSSISQVCVEEKRIPGD